ncbi:MAG: hypothetical protein HOU81_06890 [Hamadaea sp.]|uniref:hypothetical protein n=1 Tax=Hamadaea sp. TaxID=2024425 RepID=UPI0017E55774|nr:hypothetical protein [Hamadaea sp.]NUR70528.1 hypothetical protein [Hamadaea sp.]NUT18135.1 hypothetical protein [Hamadaea sp.]
MDYYVINGTDLHVEEFVLADDHTAVAIDTTSTEAALRIRREPRLARAISRAEATALGPVPGTLPFRHFLPSAPLVLSDAEPLYRMLFAGRPSSMEDLGQAWDLEPSDEPNVVGVARRTGAEWRLRDVGPGVAWAVDLSASPEVAGRLLADIRSTARRAGLIPVTVERFR